MDETVSTTELCHLAGIGYRKADYWTRLFVLQSENEALPGSGVPRRYSLGEVRIARLVDRLRALGADTMVCASVAADMRGRDKWPPELRVAHPDVEGVSWVLDLSVLDRELVAA